VGVIVGAATPAAASTLAYVKDGAVWVSAPDGSDAHEVGAGLSYPSLADNGTVYALAAPGQVDVLPPGVPARSPITIDGIGINELSVSPDGSELAWRDVQDLEDSVSVLRLSDGRQTNWLSDAWPKWFSDQQLAMAGPNGGELFDASTDGKTTVMPDLYSPPDAYETNVVEYAVDRADDKAAAIMDFVHGGGPPGDPHAHTLVVFSAADGAPATDTGNYCALANSYQQPIEASDLAWAPDGSELAWQQADGIHIATIGQLDNQCANADGTSQLTIPGGSEPAWGPSDDRRFPEPGGSTGGGGGGGGGGQTGPPPVPKLTAISTPKGLKAGDAVKHGIRIRLTLPTTGTLIARATTSKKAASKHHIKKLTVATGTVHAHTAGTVTIILHVASSDASAVRHAHGLPLRLTLTLGQLSATRTLTLR
jgi:hypothetical protein